MKEEINLFSQCSLIMHSVWRYNILPFYDSSVQCCLTSAIFFLGSIFDLGIFYCDTNQPKVINTFVAKWYTNKRSTSNSLPFMILSVESKQIFPFDHSDGNCYWLKSSYNNFKPIVLIVLNREGNNSCVLCSQWQTNKWYQRWVQLF